MASPWADVRDQAQPLPPADMPPSVWATPDVSLPTNAPAVHRAPSPLEDQIGHDQQALQKVQWAQANPWGSPENHPGKLGKIAHAFSVLGNVAGDVFAPNVMARIPGTQLNMQEREGELNQRLGKEQEEESQNEARGAQTEHTQEETREMPGKEASTEALQGAQTGNLESETAQRNQPDLAHAYAHAVNDAIKRGVDPAQDPIVQHLSDAITSIQPNANKQVGVKESQPIMGPDGKPHVYALDAQGNKVKDLGVHYERPQQAPGLTVVTPEGVVQRLGVGATMAPGSMTPQQMGSQNVAANKEQKAEQKAEANLDNELSLMKQFAANPSPTNDAAMLMHYIGATKPESMGKIRLNERELTLFGGTRSSLGDLQALLSKVENGQSLTPTQRQDMVNTMTMIAQAAKRGNGSTGNNGGEPKRPANVPEGYVFKDGPKGKGWYRP